MLVGISYSVYSDDVTKVSGSLAGPCSLRWRIHSRFDDYIRNSTGDGTVSLACGAWRDEGGYYNFPEVDISGPLDFYFGGSVEFFAYMGVLSLQITEPSLHFLRDEAHLEVSDALSPGSRLELASASFDAANMRDTHLDLRLSEEGSEMFFGKYPTGSRLEPVDISFLDLSGVQPVEGP